MNDTCQICNQPYIDRWILQINDVKGIRVELPGHEDCLRPVKLKLDELDKQPKKLTVDQKLKQIKYKEVKYER
jgi:hypothetical protein